MSAKVWWPLFPLLFVIVLACLFTALYRFARRGGGRRIEWATLSLSLLFYFLTFLLGRWRALHMPVSNVAELLMLYNVIHFFRIGRREIAWLNVIALIAVGIDFFLHHAMR